MSSMGQFESRRGRRCHRRPLVQRACPGRRCPAGAPTLRRTDAGAYAARRRRDPHPRPFRGGVRSPRREQGCHAQKDRVVDETLGRV